MISEMKNKRRQLDFNGALQILIDGEYGVLATNGKGGYNYATPLNYVYVDGNLYFHGALEGHKMDNIAMSNNVSFCVVGRTQVLPSKFTAKYESVIVFGKAFIAGEEEKRKVLTAFIKKYSPCYEQQGENYINRASRYTCVVRMEVEQLTGKAAMY